MSTLPLSVLFPSGTSDRFEPEAERQFLREYRGTALHWAKYASAFGSMIYLSFLLIALLFEPATSEAITVRVLLIVALALLVCILRSRCFITVENYVPVAASVVTVVIGLTILLPTLKDDGSEAAAVQASPAIMIALFVMYSLLRLPAKVSAAIGVGTGASAVLFAPVVAGGSGTMRTIVYAISANVLGVFVSRLIESRERELFLQRRGAEQAKLLASERQAAAEAANGQKTRLIAAVSHDLRQPMSAAITYLDIMQRRLARDDLAGSRGPAEKVQSSLAMLGSTLDHLLTAARYESGTEALTIRQVEIRPLLQDLFEAYVPEAERRGVELRMRLPRRLPLLETDTQAISRILGNLISNSIKFSDPTKDFNCVLVAARFVGGRCRIDIIDTGIGIDPCAVDMIWKPYVQLNNVERDRERGLGLGLFLVQKILEQLPGHSIELDSRPGRGSRFTIRLPTAKATQEQGRRVSYAGPSALPNLRSLVHAHALVLEDDRDIRLSILELLSEWEVRSVAGPSVVDVLTQLERGTGRIDAIICDYRLASGTNGIDAIARLRQWLGYAPHAVLITGEADVEPLRARVGPDTVVLRKPFSPEVLARLLLEAVRARGRAGPG